MKVGDGNPSQGGARPNGNPTLKVAILGGGMIANLHRRAATLAGANIVGVLDKDPALSRALAQRWGVPRAFLSIDELLESEVDVVHVCTPNSTHYGYTMAALRAGKHVICEKPLGISPAQADEMATTAADRGLLGAVPYVYRFHPLVREIRARRMAGEFGAWNLLHGSYLQDWLLSPESTSWRVDPKLNGASRAFADIGSHWCDLVEWVSGERIAEVSAELNVAISRRPLASGPTFSDDLPVGDLQEVSTEDSAIVSFRTENGVLGAAVISQVAAGRKNRLWFELDGMAGSVAFNQEDPETIWLGGVTSTSIVRRDPLHGAAEERRLSQLPAGHPQGWGYCFESFVADTYSSIRGETPEGLPTFGDGARSLRLIEAVLQSAESHSWTRVDDRPLSRGQLVDASREHH